MGTDIHMRAEVKKNGKWNLVGNVFKNAWYDENRESSSYNRQMTNEPYNGRNYDLFAILADVRNGSGFAGCKTSDGFKPIAKPKGFPEDASNEIKEVFWFGDEDGSHSASYLTVKEIEDFDWNQKIMHCGVISEAEYLSFKSIHVNPTSWAGGVGGQSIVTVDESTMDKILNKKIDRNLNVNYYVQCKFNPVTYRECCECFLNDTVLQLKQLIPKDGGTSDVRIVFCFDS